MSKVEGSQRHLRKEIELLKASLRELIQAMRRYEMDVDESPPYEHREMIRRAEELLQSQEDQGDG